MSYNESINARIPEKEFINRLTECFCGIDFDKINKDGEKNLSLKDIQSQINLMNYKIINGGYGRNPAISSYYRYPLETLYSMGDYNYSFVGVLIKRSEDRFYIENVHWTFSIYMTNHVVIHKSKVDRRIWNKLENYKKGEIIYFTGKVYNYIKGGGEHNFGINITDIEFRYKCRGVKADLESIKETNERTTENKIDINRPITINEETTNIIFNYIIAKINISKIYRGAPDIFSINRCYNIIYCRDMDLVLANSNPMILHYKTPFKTKLIVFGALSYLVNECKVENNSLLDYLMNCIFKLYIEKYAEMDELVKIRDNMGTVKSVREYNRRIKNINKSYTSEEIFSDEFIETILLNSMKYAAILMREIL